MQQTMLGLLALMTAMLISLNVQRASLTAQMEVIDSEMETIAGGVALEVLDHVGLVAFDEQTKEEEVENRGDLTPQPFSTGKQFDDADDIDDFHQMQTSTIEEFGFDFEVDMTVEYVDEDDPEQYSASQTFAKKVTVTVSNTNLRTPVQIAHVYTYP